MAVLTSPRHEFIFFISFMDNQNCKTIVIEESIIQTSWLVIKAWLPFNFDITDDIHVVFLFYGVHLCLNVLFVWQRKQHFFKSFILTSHLMGSTIFFEYVEPNNSKLLYTDH